MVHTSKHREPKHRSNTPNLAKPISHQAPRDEFRRRGLIVVAVTLMILGAAFLLYPFVPMIRYAVSKPAPEAPYETRLSSLTTTPSIATSDPSAPSVPVTINPGTIAQPSSGKVKPKPVSNRLVIPKIGVDVEIVEGTNEAVALNQGIWRIPGTSTPDKGKNTVLSGHRFRFLSGSRTLYLLDKVTKGDPIIVYWGGKEYDYVVSDRKIVTPNHVEILDPTTDPRLTIFTCSPLFSTKERLVLFADLLAE